VTQASARRRAARSGPAPLFLYNNWDFNALGAIYEKLAGRGIYAAFGAPGKLTVPPERYFGAVVPAVVSLVG
jgi:hypothetical protein